MTSIERADLPPIRSAANRLRIVAMVLGAVVAYTMAWLATASVFAIVFTLILAVPVIKGDPITTGFLLTTYLALSVVAVLGALFLVPTRRRSLARILAREVHRHRLDVPPPREVEQLLEALAIALNIDAPRVEMLDAAVPNAYVIGTRPRDTTIGVTVGLVDALTRAELEAVLAWLMVRIANRDVALTTWAAAIAADAVRELDVLGSTRAANPFAFGVTGRVVGAPARWVVTRYEVLVLRARAQHQDEATVISTFNPKALLRAFEILHANAEDIPFVSRATAPLWVEVPSQAFSGDAADRRLGLQLGLGPRIAALRVVTEESS